MLPTEVAYKLYADLDGNPLDNGYIYFGQVDQNPITSPVTVYWDAAGTQPAAQPIRTEDGYIVRNGTPANVFCSGAYSQLVQDKRHIQIYYAHDSTEYSVGQFFNNLTVVGPSTGAAMIGGAVQVTNRVATLRKLLKTSASTYAYTCGYHAPGDGGNAHYHLDLADTTTPDNGGTVIVANDGGRWKLDDSLDFNLRQFGAKGDGVTDDTIALNSAITQCISTGRRCLKVPAGVYLLTDEINKTFNGINGFSMEGDGSSVTEFRFSGATNGFSFFREAEQWWLELSPSSGFNFSGFTVTTNNVNSGVGFYVSGGALTGRPPRRTMFEDVEFRGLNDFSHSWARHTVIENVSDVWFNSCRWVIGGSGNLNNIGVELIGAVGKDPSGFYFNHCEALYGNIWIKAGSNVEGIYLTQCSHVAGHMAVQWIAGAESGFHVVGGHYNNNGTGNFYLSGIFDFEIVGPLLYSDGHGATAFEYIHASNGGRFTISDTVFNTGGAGTETGVAVDSSAGGAGYGSMIGNNTFNALNGSPINLTPSSTYVTVGVNSYNNCTGPDVLNSGTTNRVEKRRYVASSVINLVGGAPSEVVNVGIPAGIFRDKAEVALISANDIIVSGFYNYTNVGNSATNMNVTLRRIDGINLAAGPIRLSIIAES